MSAAEVTALPASRVVMPLSDVFDYTAVDVDIAVDLRARAGRIRERIKATTDAVIAIGNDLIRVRMVLPHGEFLGWVQAECGFSERAARYYMGAAEFAEGKPATVADLAPAILYKLAAKSTPAEIVQTVLARAEAGEIIPAASIKTMLDEARVQKQQDKQRLQQNARRSKRGQARLEEAKQRERERREQELREDDAAAQEIIDRIGIENARFVAEKLADIRVMIGLQRLLGDDEGAA